MPPSHVLHPPARLARLLHNHRSERGIVLATPLAHDLDPLHRSSHCGCHTGSLIFGIHASQQNDKMLATQGGRGRTLTTIVPDVADIPATRAARSEVLGDRKPASTLIVAGLANPTWKVEIEAVAVA